MNKRKLGSFALSVVLITLGFPAKAQQPKKVFRIEYLSSADPAFESARSESIRLALRELGYIEGQNIAIEYLVTGGDSVMGDDLNLMAGHPDLVEFVERTLRTTYVILMRAVVWAKYASARDFTQALHADYMQDSLLYPSRADAAEQVTTIPYYLKVTIDLGPTYIVANSRMADVSFVPFLRPQPQYAELYELERPVLVATAYWEALIDYYATLAARPRDTGLARAPEATPPGVEAKR